MADYDIGEAFAKIENELISNMIRNMDRHRAEEIAEGYNWSQWQAEQLKSLEEYKKRNKKKYNKQFKSINSRIDSIINTARSNGNMNQEIKILNAIKNGFKAETIPKGTYAEFFKINDRKLDALIKATTEDIHRAEKAILRMANDKYRKVIFNAQVYANSGAATYEKAVDMATKDMRQAGLNCIEYKNGARHTLADYADMALRTASKRAYLTGEGEKRAEWGIHTVIMNKRGNACPKCLPFVGKVMIDDVWSGGTAEEAAKTGYGLMSTAIAAGLYHPRCKDSHTTYFSGITTQDKPTKEEKQEVCDSYNNEIVRQYAKRQAEKYQRMEDTSLDDENQKKYAVRREEWKRKEEKNRIEESGQIDKEILKKDINSKKAELKAIEKRLLEAKNSEKELTQKVYFDGVGVKNIIAKSTNSDIMKVDKIVSGHNGTPKKANPGMVIDHLGENGKTETRTFYGSDSFKKKDITNHDHNNPKQHPFGKNGEHAHDYEWDNDGRLKNRTIRDITDVERKENGDIL